MAKRKLFLWLAAASGYIGIGMLLGYSFSDKTSNTAMWIGLLLVLLAAILLGMYISARSESPGAVRDGSASSVPPQNTTD